MSTQETNIKGGASDIGQGLFIELCLPTVREASKVMPPNHLAQLYAGFIGACFGAMVADFGQDGALIVVETMREAMGKFTPPGVTLQ